MPFSLSEVSPAVVGEEGGHLLQISGSFQLNHRYEAHLGDTGSVLDASLYSGIPGQGTILRPVTVEVIQGFSPRVPVNVPLAVYVIDLDTEEEQLLPGVVEARPRQFMSTVFTMRKLMPPIYFVGLRNLE